MEHEINFNSDSSFVRIKSGEKQAKTADNIIANLPLALVWIRRMWSICIIWTPVMKTSWWIKERCISIGLYIVGNPRLITLRHSPLNYRRLPMMTWIDYHRIAVTPFQRFMFFLSWFFVGLVVFFIVSRFHLIVPENFTVWFSYEI